MKSRTLFPVIFGLALTGFTAFSTLDTLVIERIEKNVNIDDVDDFFSNKKSSNSSSNSLPNSSNIPSSSSTNSSIPSINSSSNSSVTSSSGTSSNSNSSSTSIERDNDEYFTENVVITEDTYSSPDIYIKIKIEKILSQNVQYPNNPEKRRTTRIYSADVRLKSLASLKTALAKDSYGTNITEFTSVIAKRKNAIFAVNGDTYGAQESGYVIRNGQLLRNIPSSRDGLAIYRDGSFEIINEKEVTANELVDKGAYQVFTFGPGLVQNGERLVDVNDEVAVFDKSGNQRCAIGIVDPLHYVFAVNDARITQPEEIKSHNLYLWEMADYMIGLGAKTAYNLDGGGSATFYFNGEVLNNPTTDGRKITERGISDIVYVA